jgi:hypothetical protein
MNFMGHAVDDGRRRRTLNLIEDYSRESFPMEVGSFAARLGVLQRGATPIPPSDTPRRSTEMLPVQ